MSDGEETILWYIADGGPAPQGPLSLRDVDVKFRTGELKSTYFAWSEQIGGDWKQINQIEQLRKILQESVDEVTPDIQKQLPQQDKKGEEKNLQKEDVDKGGNDDLEDADGLAYYNHEEKVFKVFDVESATWKAQKEKPSQEQLNKIRAQKLAGLEETKKEGEEDYAEPAAGDEPEQQVDGEKDEPPSPLLTEEELKKRELKKLKRKRAQQNKKKRWFETNSNTFVYMSGLPEDTTKDELHDFAKKCGVIRLDPNTGELKIKIYLDETGKSKGDARICYQNMESVQMAIDLLNENQIRPGFPIGVEQANFEQKGEDYRPREAPKVDKTEKLRIRAALDRQKFAWNEEEMHDIGLKIVILENFYTIEEVEQSQVAYENLEEPISHFFKEIEGELREEIEQKVGPIDKVELFKENAVCKIKFASAIHAEACIKLMDGRGFSYRQLKCTFWDGKTDFKKNREDNAATAKRVEQFGEWLEGQDLAEELQAKKEDSDDSGTLRKRDQKEQTKMSLQDLSEKEEEEEEL